jgi:2-keto-4-pentenoate hydratase/2-oxohepta-3-ene-1,7-dioic acid hydratase in catechol pathway
VRLVTYLHNGLQKVGAWIDDDARIVDLDAADARANGKPSPAFRSMQSLIEAGPAALDRARALIASPNEAVVATSDVRLLAPLPRPIQVRDALAFPAHLEGCNATLIDLAAAASPDPVAAREAAIKAGKLQPPPGFFAFPTYYICNSLSTIGPDDVVDWPSFSNFIDYELEFAAVIGREGRGIARADALGHIFGYTIFNDWSARDEQIKAMESGVGGVPSPGKDFANAFGPCIVTADEVGDPYDLQMEVSLNGRRVGGGSTSGMHYRFEDLIEYLTRANAMFPGEIIGSGTVGTGCSLENRQLVKHGDTVELKVERIGVLKNRVSAPHLEGALPDSFMHALGSAIQRARKAVANN